jgi:hypothetical protein
MITLDFFEAVTAFLRVSTQSGRLALVAETEVSARLLEEPFKAAMLRCIWLCISLSTEIKS